MARLFGPLCSGSLELCSLTKAGTAPMNGNYASNPHAAMQQSCRLGTRDGARKGGRYWAGRLWMEAAEVRGRGNRAAREAARNGWMSVGSYVTPHECVGARDANVFRRELIDGYDKYNGRG